jgi:hypothetical protein
LYDDPKSYVNRHNKGNNKSKRDKLQKKTYFEKNYHKVNKVAQINSKSYATKGTGSTKETSFKPILGKLQKDIAVKKKGIEVLYIQMEYCEGENLKNYIKKKQFRDVQNLTED